MKLILGDVAEWVGDGFCFLGIALMIPGLLVMFVGDVIAGRNS